MNCVSPLELMINEPVGSAEYVVSVENGDSEQPRIPAETIVTPHTSNASTTTESLSAIAAQAGVIDSKLYKLAKRSAIVVCTVLLAVLISLSSVLNSINNN